MKYISIILLLLSPLNAFAAVAFGHSSAQTTTSQTTTLSFSHDATGDTWLQVVLNARIACNSTDVTNLSVTYGGQALTFDKGTANTSVQNNPASDCVHGYLLHLANPPTGSNTLSISWTTNAWMSATAMSFSGAGSIGTITETKTTGSFSASATITANDMVMGALAISDNVVNWSMNNSNAIETSDTGGDAGTAANTNTGSGSVNVSGNYAIFGTVFWAIPIIAGTPYTPLNQNIIYGTLNNACIATSC